MAKKITDDEDQLKRQARRRLIGAVALTTAIVVILPMVLENEPKPIGQDIELRIPDKDKVGAFVPKIDLPPASTLLASSSVSASDVASVPAVANQPISHVAVTPATTAIVSGNSPVLQPAKAMTTEPVKKTEQAKQTDTTHAEQGQSIPKASLALQIGAFSNADTAHTWQKNLIQQGFKAYTEKVDNKLRVRIGPYSSREAATKARHKLEEKGLHSNIVELD
jgi:DedD protein